VEIRVPYSQATTFLQVYTNNGNYTMSGATITPDSYSNGIITMRVVNPLSGPQAVTTVPVLVFVRAAENIEYAVPYNRLASISATTTSQYTPFALQSGEIEYPVKPKQVIVGNKPTVPDPNRYLVHFGEKVTSFRPLIHRLYRQYTLQTPALATAATLNIVRHKTSRRFKFFGYSSNAYWTGAKTVGVGNTNVNYVRCTIPQLVSLLFVGQRGSITQQYNVEGNAFNPYQGFSNMTLSRYDGTITPTTQFITYDNNSSTSISNQAAIAMNFQTEPYSGVALTDQRLQPAISANFPYYSNYNFQFVNPLYSDAGNTTDGTDSDNVILTIVSLKGFNNSNPATINAWYGYGPDYNFFFFLNCPSLYGIAIPAGA